jgi:histone H3/H4
MSTKQKAKGTSTQKHRKILRDNIAGITKPALLRILRRAGIKRVSGLVYEEMRGLLKEWLVAMVRDMVIFMEYARRKTVQLKDLEAALSNHGIMLAAGINDNAKRTASLQSCNSRGKSSRPVKKPTAAVDDGADATEKKSHRFRPGTVAKREVVRHQKNSDCLAIPKLNFNRLTRELAQDFHTDLRFSETVFDLLQLAAEEYLIQLSSAANACCLHAKRETVSSEDFRLAKLLRR